RRPQRNCAASYRAGDKPHRRALQKGRSCKAGFSEQGRSQSTSSRSCAGGEQVLGAVCLGAVPVFERTVLRGYRSRRAPRFLRGKANGGESDRPRASAAENGECQMRSLIG